MPRRAASQASRSGRRTWAGPRPSAPALRPHHEPGEETPYFSASDARADGTESRPAGHARRADQRAAAARSVQANGSSRRYRAPARRRRSWPEEREDGRERLPASWRACKPARGHRQRRPRQADIEDACQDHRGTCEGAGIAEGRRGAEARSERKGADDFLHAGRSRAAQQRKDGWRLAMLSQPGTARTLRRGRLAAPGTAASSQPRRSSRRPARVVPAEASPAKKRRAADPAGPDLRASPPTWQLTPARETRELPGRGLAARPSIHLEGAGGGLTPGQVLR